MTRKDVKSIHTVLAIDLGASGGRAILCHFDGERLHLDEVHRFVNNPVEKDGYLMWDFDMLLSEIKTGIKKAAEAVPFESIGIDTWGVDYGIVRGDKLIEGPVCYRDTRTRGLSKEIPKGLHPFEMYLRVGIQMMEINTIYQLEALKREKPELFIDPECKLLMMPDLFNWALSGKATAEITISSTTQLFDPHFKRFDYGLIRGLGFNNDMFQKTVEPGEFLGMLKDDIREELGLPESHMIKILAVAGHDTASAVAAVPFNPKKALFLSSGTWCLIGAELEQAMLTRTSADANLSNEVGYGGKIRYLKNVTGLWLVQQMRESMKKPGRDLGFEDMENLAKSAKPYELFIDPDAEVFSLPGDDMLQRIHDYLVETCQAAVSDIEDVKYQAQVLRCVYDSIALKVRMACDKISENLDRNFKIIHMVGGGIQSELLCQTIADLTQRTVHAGPVEATALGNAAAQFIAGGYIKNHEEARRIIGESFEVKVYEPGVHLKAANKAYKEFQKLISNN